MHQEITITNEDIQYAEQILLSEGNFFDDERKDFIKNLETIDLQAVPGSGKTTALLAKLIVLERELPFTDGSGILVLSHTNTAIDEIKNKIQSYCPKLFQYPNFIGTIQSFVDNFLAIPYYTQFQKKKPYRIDDEVYNEYIDKILSKIFPYRYKLDTNDFKKIQYIAKSNPSLFKSTRLTTAPNNEIIVSEKINGEKFDVKKPKGKTKNYNDYTNEEKDKLYNWFLQFKKNILEDGILNFDDTYFLANRYLQNFPTIKKIIQKRFSYVFVDEMQDMDKGQYDLLEKLFYDNGNSISKFQRIGDKNQAIYNDIENENTWIDRVQVLTLSNSHRLSPNIANVVKKFALDCSNEFDIVGKNNCDIKPHIILYDNSNKNNVIQKFAELIQDFRKQGKLSDYGKYPIKAICWTSWKNENSQIDGTKIKLEDYFPNYQKNEAKPKQNYSCLMDYLRYYDKNSKTLNAVQNNIINAFLKILHLENIVSDKGYYTKTKLMNVLREKDTIFYEQFRLKIFNWSLSLLKGNLEEVWNEIKDYINEFLNFIENNSIKNSLEFINHKSQDSSVSVSYEITQNNYHHYDDICIEITSVHSVKGQTHCATLYLESFYQRGYGNYESERLRNQFLNKNTVEATIATISNGHNYIKNSAKMTYVGFSRPTNFLCIAIHQDRFKLHLSDIDRNVWKIITM